MHFSLRSGHQIIDDDDDDLVTQALGQVNFSLWSLNSNLVIRTQHKDADDIFELIPQEQLHGDLPVVLIKGHAHWLNISTHIIEICPLDRLWEQSSDNWKINCASRPYQMTRGHESLVDIQSPTWNMVSCHLECLEIPGNLIITLSPVDKAHFFLSLGLSITLPRYGLSFFVNNGGDLESCDFMDMVYDEDQCVETLFGLFNQLVLHPKAQIEEEVSPRYILVLDGEPDHGWHDHKPCIIIGPHSPHRSNFLNPYCQDIKIPVNTNLTLCCTISTKWMVL